MKRIMTSAAILAFMAAPALAQSTDGGSTAGGAVVPPVSGTAPDQMGAAATTGDTTAAPANPLPPAGMEGEGMDNDATGSIERDATATGTAVPTEGMSESGAAAASDTTPSNGIVPGQSPD